MPNEVDELIKGVNELAVTKIRVPGMSEPRITKAGLKKKEAVVSVRIGPELLIELDKYVDRNGGDRSKTIRTFIMDRLEEVE